MIITIAIWSYMTFIVLASGWAVTRLIGRVTGRRWNSLSMIWMLGLCFTTVYAEVFSLFHKVGALANLILIAALGILLVTGRKEILAIRIKAAKGSFLLMLFYLLVALAIAGVSCQRAVHADTDLYHAQAIRWIEEYGAVKGLGNLHNRLAYNSAFMCLQALFSGAFLFGQSTHVVNGYIACGMLIYALHLLNHKRKEQTMDSQALLSAAVIIFICSTLGTLSSPNTDTFSLLLVLFILIKWVGLLETKSEETGHYALLCVLGVMAVSLKLSTVMIVVLAIRPFVCWVKERKIKEIFFFLLLGCAVIAPYLIRNVILSGYLIYPYSMIDLFNVDWKMAGSVVDFDRKEIMAYGRGLNSYFLSDAPFTEWFPVWFGKQAFWMKGMIAANLLLGGIHVLRCMIRRSWNWNGCLLLAAAAASFGFWLLSAPLPRYGMIFVFELPCIILGEWFKDRKIPKVFPRLLCLAGAGMTLLASAGQIAERKEEIGLKRPSYYIYRECEKTEWEGIGIYTGGENNYCGYYSFPSAPYAETLEFIEPRGTEVSEGFRVREEALSIRFNNSGTRY